MRTLPRWATTPIGSCSGPASPSTPRGGGRVSTGDLAVEAAGRCLAAGDIRPDRSIWCCWVLLPPMASAGHGQLRRTTWGSAPRPSTSGRLRGLRLRPDYRMQYVASGCSQRALVVGADCNSRMVDPADKQTYPLFGDAAGAMIVAPVAHQGLLAYAVGSDGSGARLDLPPYRRCTRAVLRRQPQRPLLPHGRPARLQVGHSHLRRRPSAKCSTRPAWAWTTSTWWSFTRPTCGSSRRRRGTRHAALPGLQQSRPLRQHFFGRHLPGAGRGLSSGRSSRQPRAFQRLGPGLTWGTVLIRW